MQEYGFAFLEVKVDRKLDEMQEKIANHIQGAVLTLAGPGSGKTTVLTERTVRLAQKTGTPERILCVTFTNVAGNEMRNRYIKAIGSCNATGENIPVFKTVHSFCNEIIKEYENITHIKYTRLEGTSGGKEKLIVELYKDINGSHPDNNVIEKICSINVNSTDLPEIKNVKKILEKYKSYKDKNRLIDFDDMIIFAKKILTSTQKDMITVKEKYCHRFDYVQVDEAQDLTAEQFGIMEIVAANGNIFVVADDDQSIYGFRGAAPECLFKFQKDFPDCKTYYLSRNYRSTKKIVDCSLKFISQNTERFKKDLYSRNEKGPLPKVKILKNGIKQAEFLLKETKKLIKQEPNIKIGILYRNNISGLLPSAVFVSNGLDYKCNGEFYKTNEVDYLDKIISEMRTIERSSVLVPFPSKILRKMKENGLYEKIENHCRETGRNMYYKDVLGEFTEYLCSRTESVAHIISVLDKIDNVSAKKYSDDCTAVEFSTVHSSKGLEYDAVFIIDVVKGEFPGRKATVGKALEEERRLFYVAMTRARKYLYVLCPQRTDGESTFVTELKKIAEQAD